MSQHIQQLPATGFLRLHQIIGRPAYKGDPEADPPKLPRPAVPGLLPISKSSWWAGVASQAYPPAYKLSKHTTAWKTTDVMALIERLGSTQTSAAEPAGRKSHEKSK